MSKILAQFLRNSEDLQADFNTPKMQFPGKKLRQYHQPVTGLDLPYAKKRKGRQGAPLAILKAADRCCASSNKSDISVHALYPLIHEEDAQKAVSIYGFSLGKF